MSCQDAAGAVAPIASNRLCARFDATPALSLWLRAAALMGFSRGFRRLTKLGQARAVAEGSGMLWRAKAALVALAVGTALVAFIAFPTQGPLSLLVGLASALAAIVYIVARDLIGGPAKVETHAPQLRRTSILPARRAHEAKQAKVAPKMQPGAQSAAGFLERLRQNLALAESEAEAVAQEVRARGFVRFRRAENNASEDLELAASPGGLSALKANDLRNYFNQRLAASVPGKTDILSPEPERAMAGTRLKFLDALLDRVVAAGRGTAPRAVLVGGTSAGDGAAAAAIAMARAFAAAGDMVVLLDLAHGPSSVSSALHLPRSPGLSDLCAGLARFEDIIRIDAETPLHTIAAGHPRFAAPGDATGRFTPILQALTQTYDSVVLHADRAALRRVGRALRFELSVVVAVLPARTGTGAQAADLGDFSAFGCPILCYEQGGEDRRARLLSWPAAI